MTVKELIDELKLYPQDLPVVVNYHEIQEIKETEAFYILDENLRAGYRTAPAIVLE